MTLPEKPGRRVIRSHDTIMDGLADLVSRADGMSVMDLGCNRGHAAFEMARNGARLCHGIDLAPDCVYCARAWFADLVEVRSQFEVGDLTTGAACLTPFGNGDYDVILMLGVIHKIRRAPSKPYRELGAVGMNEEELVEFLRHLGHRTVKYFALRGGDDDRDLADAPLKATGLRLIHQTEISGIGGYSLIWARI